MAVSDLRETEILAHLQNVLASPAFRGSQRSSQFLRYVVESALAGEKEGLKERIIGERVFGRPADYDTGQDSIVRVKASEVRRRLAQYYDNSADTGLRIELLPGSYTPWFHGVTPPAEIVEPVEELQASAPRRRMGWRGWAALAVTAVLAVAAVVVIVRNARHTPFAIFWAPFLEGARAPILCLPTPERFRIAGGDKAYLLEKFHPRPPEDRIDGLSLERLQGLQIIPETGLTLSLGDAQALTQIYAFTEGKGRTAQIRIGNDTTFTELRAGPVILIGGFSNHWTLDLMKDARFAFDMDGLNYGIRDRSTGQFVCRKAQPWEARSTEDCGVITLLRDSKTGNPLLVAAGLDHYGTLGAGEFLTRPALLERALRQAPVKWQEKNLQILFRIEIVRDNVGTPTIAATYVW
jgi:hypothetical protein